MPKYAEFLETFPTLHHIARARPARVTEAWAGLGYYARARNLHALARQVTNRGRDAHGTLPAEVVRSIGERLLGAAVAVSVNGEIQDLIFQ